MPSRSFFKNRFFKSRPRATPGSVYSQSSDTLISTTQSVALPKPDLVQHSQSFIQHDKSRSPSRSAANNALKLALQRLGGAPVPGISVATGAVLSVIDGIESMIKADKESKKLTKRIETLWYLLHNVDGIEGSQGIIDRLIEELQDFAKDMEKASKSNKLESFFNSQGDVVAIDSHNDTLGDIITDLTFCLATATKRDTAQIRNDIEEALKHLQTATDKPQLEKGGRMEIRVSDNEIQRIIGDFGTGNEVNGGNSMAHAICGNKIGFIGGMAFSNNRVSVDH